MHIKHCKRCSNPCPSFRISPDMLYITPSLFSRSDQSFLMSVAVEFKAIVRISPNPFAGSNYAVDGPIGYRSGRVTVDEETR